MCPRPVDSPRPAPSAARADQCLVVCRELVEIVDERLEFAALGDIQREDRVGNALERDRRGQLHVAFVALGLPADRLHDIHSHGPAARVGEDRGEPRADVRIDAACSRRERVELDVSLEGTVWWLAEGGRLFDIHDDEHASGAEHPDEALHGRLRIDEVAQDEARVYDVVCGPEIGSRRS